MKRFVFGAVGTLSIALAGGIGAIAWSAPQPAFACTGPSTIQQMASSPKVFAGRVTAVEEDPALGDAIYRGFRLQIDVTEGIRGATAGERIQATAKVPGQFPVMCPQFDRSETFLGKWVVTGLYLSAGQNELSRGGTAYLGLDPDGADYTDALRAARIATGADPGLPALRLAPGSPRCGAPVTVNGSNFAPGTPVLLNYPADPDDSGHFLHPTAVADAAGRFVFTFRLARDWCPLDWFVEAYEWRDDGQIGGWPLAMTPIKASESAAPLPPDAGDSAVSPDSSLPWLPVLGASMVVLGAWLRIRSRRS